MAVPVYPFTSVLAIMKPAKINKTNKNHKKQLEAIMHSPYWDWEEKLDGVNIMSIGGRFFSNIINKETKWPSEKTDKMPHVTRYLRQWPKLILNGEAYIVGKKSHDVTSIINSGTEEALRKQRERGNVPYHVYDILRDIDGTWLTGWTRKQRRDRLEELFSTVFNNEWLILNGTHNCALDDPQEALDAILAAGYEGIVLKDNRATYFPGKRPMWNQMKLKAEMDDDVVIMGFNPATRKYTGKNLITWPYWEGEVPVTSNWAKGLIGSIIIGKYNQDQQLVEVGKVTGITDSLREDMTIFPDKYIGRVIIIKAMELTEDEAYRHANFLAFHEDKNPEECVLES